VAMMALVPCKIKTVKRRRVLTQTKPTYCYRYIDGKKKNTLEEADEPASMQAIILLAWYLCCL
jgi:hypothetical protein